MNMSRSDLQSYLESVEFDAKMQVFSGFKTFYSALENNEVIAGLVQALARSEALQQQLFNRLVELANVEFDQNYAHPHDVPIATYLYALEKVNPELVSQVLETLSRYWLMPWTKRLAEHILAARLNVSPRVQSGNKIISGDFTQPRGVHRSPNQAWRPLKSKQNVLQEARIHSGYILRQARVINDMHGANFTLRSHSKAATLAGKKERS
jgi:hypothetical protein